MANVDNKFTINGCEYEYIHILQDIQSLVILQSQIKLQQQLINNIHYHWFLSNKNINNIQLFNQRILNIQKQYKIIINIKTEIQNQQSNWLKTNYQEFYKYVFICQIQYIQNVLDIKKLCQGSLFVVICIIQKNDEIPILQETSRYGVEIIFIQDKYLQETLKHDIQARNESQQRETVGNFIFKGFAQGNKKYFNILTQTKTNENQIILKFFDLMSKNKSLTYQCNQYQKLFMNSKEKFMEKLIVFYTNQSFFYQVLNRILRNCSSLTSIFYIQPFYKRMYHDINSMYISQKSDNTIWGGIFPSTVKQFNCFRGGRILAQQIQLFKQNIGQTVQCFSFLSASYCLKQAINFMENVLFVIKVKKQKQFGQFDNGYVFVEKLSRFSQKQVLMNSMCVFTVNDVKQDIKLADIFGDQNLSQIIGGMIVTVIYLEYGYGDAFQFKKRYGANNVILDKQKAVMNYIEYQNFTNNYQRNMILMLKLQYPILVKFYEIKSYLISKLKNGYNQLLDLSYLIDDIQFRQWFKQYETVQYKMMKFHQIFLKMTKYLTDLKAYLNEKNLKIISFLRKNLQFIRKDLINQKKGFDFQRHRQNCMIKEYLHLIELKIKIGGSFNKIQIAKDLSVYRKGGKKVLDKEISSYIEDRLQNAQMYSDERLILASSLEVKNEWSDYSQAIARKQTDQFLKNFFQSKPLRLDDNGIRIEQIQRGYQWMINDQIFHLLYGSWNNIEYIKIRMFEYIHLQKMSDMLEGQKILKSVNNFIMKIPCQNSYYDTIINILMFIDQVTIHQILQNLYFQVFLEAILNQFENWKNVSLHNYGYKIKNEIVKIKITFFIYHNQIQKGINLIKEFFITPLNQDNTQLTYRDIILLKICLKIISGCIPEQIKIPQYFQFLGYLRSIYETNEYSNQIQKTKRKKKIILKKKNLTLIQKKRKCFKFLLQNCFCLLWIFSNDICKAFKYYLKIQNLLDVMMDLKGFDFISIQYQEHIRIGTELLGVIVKLIQVEDDEQFIQDQSENQHLETLARIQNTFFTYLILFHKDLDLDEFFSYFSSETLMHYIELYDYILNPRKLKKTNGKSGGYQKLKNKILIHQQLEVNWEYLFDDDDKQQDCFCYLDLMQN